MPQIRYLGCITDKDGRDSDPEKIEDIRHMPVPKNVQEVRSLLGMVSYYGSFVAEIRRLCAPLDALVKKNITFRWTKECEAASNRAKEVLALDLLLTHFDSSLPIVVAANASDYGIKTAILLNGTGRPYVMEAEVLLQPRRITKTTELGQPDALSRLIPVRQAQTEDTVIAKIEQDIVAVQNAAVEALPVIKIAKKNPRRTRRYRKIVRMVQTGRWPAKPSEETHKWKALSHALSVQNRCLYLGHRIVIPATLQEKVLKQLHEGHPGMTRMKMLARGYVYWTNINRDVEEAVRRCRNCQEAAKMPVKTALNSWATETKPWERIHINYAGPLNRKMYLVVVDAYSKWPEVFEMSLSSTVAVMRELRMLFATFGNPRVIASDNGTQFRATEIQEFCKKRGIEHIRSPPFHPQSNSQAERFVDILKRTLQKIKEGGTMEKLAEFLQCCRRTPSTSVPGSLSPAEVFLGRQMRTPVMLLKEPTREEGTRIKKMEEQVSCYHGAQKRAYKTQEIVWVRDSP